MWVKFQIFNFNVFKKFKKLILVFFSSIRSAINKTRTFQSKLFNTRLSTVNFNCRRSNNNFVYLHLCDNHIFPHQSTKWAFSFRHSAGICDLCEFHCTGLWHVSRSDVLSSPDVSHCCRTAHGQSHSLFRFHYIGERRSLDVSMDFRVNLSQARFLWRLKSHSWLRTGKTRVSWNLLPLSEPKEILGDDWCLW